jgi:hypothetical protein
MRRENENNFLIITKVSKDCNHSYQAVTGHIFIYLFSIFIRPTLCLHRSFAVLQLRHWLFQHHSLHHHWI